MQSILLVTKSNPYQITLVDDCSNNSNFVEEISDEFKKNTPSGVKPQVQCVRTDHHMGFGGACREGYDHTEQPWVCFLHSDCMIEDQNWLISMGQSLMNWKKEGVPVKMVSARTNNPGDDVSSFLKADSKEPIDDVVLQEGHLPLYCAMCHRDLFYHIGGFIKPYPYAWYEDVELAARMQYYGFRQGICGKSWVRHKGSATIDFVWEQIEDSKLVMEENRNRCIRDLKTLA